MKDKLPADIRSALVKVTTPFSVGSGLLLPQQGLVATSLGQLSGQRTVVVRHAQLGRQLARVVFLDAAAQLALLRLSADTSGLRPLRLAAPPEAGSLVFIFYRQGRRGCASLPADLTGVQAGRLQLQPLLDSGRIAATDDLLVVDESGQLIGFADAARFAAAEGTEAHSLQPLQQALHFLHDHPAAEAARCASCSNLTIADTTACAFCGSPLQTPGQLHEYEPEGISRTIEQILAKLGKQPALARVGANTWRLREADRPVSLTYHPPTGLLSADASLGYLSPEYEQTVGDYLLRQNYALRGMNINSRGTRIQLSLLIYDCYLQPDTAFRQLQLFFERTRAISLDLENKYGSLQKMRSDEEE
jgi:hypothetical protein